MLRIRIRIRIHHSGSESISQRHGSANPDPHQNVMGQQHCSAHRKHFFSAQVNGVMDVFCQEFTMTSTSWFTTATPFEGGNFILQLLVFLTHVVKFEFILRYLQQLYSSLCVQNVEILALYFLSFQNIFQVQTCCVVDLEWFSPGIQVRSGSYSLTRPTQIISKF